jgi:hypothetical protein
MSPVATLCQTTADDMVVKPLEMTWSSLFCQICMNPINVNDSDTRVRGWVFKHRELMEIGTKLLWLT